MARAPSKSDPTGTAIKRDALDLSQPDLAKPKRKRRRKRNLPNPRDDLAATKAELLKRALERPIPPHVAMEPAGYDQEHWTAPHNDEDLWWFQLADAFGTRSYSVMVFFLNQIEALCGRNIWDEEARQWRLDEHTFSAILAIVNSVKPEDELQAALAAQMASVHIMQMKTAARAIRYDSDTKTASVSAKLAKTFAGQLETLQAIKGEKRIAEQSIKVTKELHQHVHYHDHRQGGWAEIGGQPDEPRAATIEGSASLPRQIEGHGSTLSRSGNARETDLPQTRKRKPGGTKGQG